MSEARTEKPAKPSARQRQTIKLNESTNEAVPRKKALRRTYPGDVPISTPTPTSPVEGEGSDAKGVSHAR